MKKPIAARPTTQPAARPGARVRGFVCWALGTLLLCILIALALFTPEHLLALRPFN